MKDWRMKRKLNDDSKQSEKNEETVSKEGKEEKLLTQRPGAKYELFVDPITCGQLKSIILVT